MISTLLDTSERLQNEDGLKRKMEFGDERMNSLKRRRQREKESADDRLAPET